MNSANAGKVYLVGAGPGDPELLTLRAARLLSDADVVLHDDLVPAAILNFAAGRALLMSVGKRCGRKTITQAAIGELMIASARRGLTVLRLKSGDPAIFSRGGEEMDALRAAQVPFEVVPGVTAASAAAALLRVPLTDRRCASKLIFLSGHRGGGDDFEKLFDAPLRDNETLAIYMPGSDLKNLVAALLRRGLAGSTPCALIRDASRPEEAFTVCRIGEVASLAASAGIGAGSSLGPALGPALGPVFGPRLLLVGRSLAGVLDRGSDRAAGKEPKATPDTMPDGSHRRGGIAESDPQCVP